MTCRKSDMGKRPAAVELFVGNMGSIQWEIRPSMQREDKPTMETGLERIAAKVTATKAVPPLPRATGSRGAVSQHTAQVTTVERADIEERFKAAPAISPVNLLSCSPTLEMGIDVGGLDAVVLRNVPPRPDNYAQRGGRAGRRSRVGMVVGYARSTPHDQYFYDKPREMIAGEVPAPAVNLGNRDVIVRHLHAIVFGAANPGLSGKMVDYVEPSGALSRFSAGRSNVAPEIPPSSYRSGTSTQPSAFWLTMYDSQDSRWASSELNSCSNPSSLDLRVYTAQRSLRMTCFFMARAASS
jgi:hypothetical protein